MSNMLYINSDNGLYFNNLSVHIIYDENRILQQTIDMRICY